MDLHERTPLAWSGAALRRAAQRSPRRARWTVIRVLLGVAMLPLVLAPGGILWFIIGLALIVSGLTFVVAAGEWSIAAPAMVLDARPKWGGQRFVAWRLETDGLGRGELDRLLAEMCEALDETAGPSERVGDDRTTRAAWGLGAQPSIDAGVRGAGRSADGPPEPGIWLRVDHHPEPEEPVVMWLASEGDADLRLRAVAASLDRSS